MTEKLFYLDSHLQRFSAQVEQCVPDGENWQIVLDRTAFFPEGGGQYADTGILGSARVLDVQEKDGVIFHRTDAPLSVGDCVARTAARLIRSCGWSASGYHQKK